MADEAETPVAAPEPDITLGVSTTTVSVGIPVSVVKELLAQYEHDFIGRAHEIVQGIKDLVAKAEAEVEAVIEKVEEAL
jgi:hypothetical protein